MITKMPSELRRGDLLHVEDGRPAEVLSVVYERRAHQVGVMMQIAVVPIICCKGGDRLEVRPDIPVRMAT